MSSSGIWRRRNDRQDLAGHSGRCTRHGAHGQYRAGCRAPDTARACPVRRRIQRQPACKPGSVWPGPVDPDVAAIPLGRALLRASCNLPGWLAEKTPEASFLAIPIQSCSRWGLPCRSRCRQRGGLLPHPFTLTLRWKAVCFLWHFPWGHPRRTLSGTVFPWSPDFPHLSAFAIDRRGRPAGWRSFVARTGHEIQCRTGRIWGARHRQPRAASRARKVRTVERSAMPSTRAGRKCRWNAAMTLRVWASQTPSASMP
jgi:hypothetical protein